MCHPESSEGKHYHTWWELVMLNQLKGWIDIGKEDPGKEREAFSSQGLYEKSLRWIAVDDQVSSNAFSCLLSLQLIDVGDSWELWDLLLFIGVDLQDWDIPHHMKLSKMIMSRFKIEHKKWLGIFWRVSNYLYLASCKYIAECTQPYCTNQWPVVTTEFGVIHGNDGPLLCKIALVIWLFSHIWSHSAISVEVILELILAKYLFRFSKRLIVWARFVILQFLRTLVYTHPLQIGTINMDSVSNNNTMMYEISDELCVMYIPFGVDGNCIW